MNSGTKYSSLAAHSRSASAGSMNSFASSSSSAGPSPSSCGEVPAAVSRRVNEEEHDASSKERVLPSPSTGGNYRTYTLSSAASFSSRPPSVPASVLAKVRQQQHARISASSSSASSSRHGSPTRPVASVRREEDTKEVATTDSSPPPPQININHSSNASPLPFEPSSSSPSSSPSPAHNNVFYLMTSEQSPPPRYTHAFSGDGLDGDSVEASDNGVQRTHRVAEEERRTSSTTNRNEGVVKATETTAALPQKTFAPSSSSSPHNNNFVLPVVAAAAVVSSSRFEHPSLAAIRSRSNSPMMMMVTSGDGGEVGIGSAPRLPRSRAGSFSHPSIRNASAEGFSLQSVAAVAAVETDDGGITPTPKGGVHSDTITQEEEGLSSVAPSGELGGSENIVGFSTTNNTRPAMKLFSDGRKDERGKEEKEVPVTASLQSINVQSGPQKQTAQPLQQPYVPASQEVQRPVPPTLSSGSFSLRDIVALEKYSSVLGKDDAEDYDDFKEPNVRVAEGEETAKQFYSSPDQQLIAPRLRNEQHDDFGEPQMHCSPPPSSKWAYSRAEAFSPVAPIYRAAKGEASHPRQHQYSLLSSSPLPASSATPQRRHCMHGCDPNNSDFNHYHHTDGRDDEKGNNSDTTATSPPLLLSPRQIKRMRREAAAATVVAVTRVSSATPHSSERRRRSAEQIRDTAENNDKDRGNDRRDYYACLTTSDVPTARATRGVFGSPPADTAERLLRDEEVGGDHFYHEDQRIEGFRWQRVDQEGVSSRAEGKEDDEDLVSEAQHLDEEERIEIVNHRTAPFSSYSSSNAGMWQQTAVEKASKEESSKSDEVAHPPHHSSTTTAHRFPRIERYLPYSKSEAEEREDDDKIIDSAHFQNKIPLRDPHHVLFKHPYGDADGYDAFSVAISERAGSGLVGRSLSIPSLRREEDLERKTQQVIEAARRARSERQDRWRGTEERRLVHLTGGELRQDHSPPQHYIRNLYSSPLQESAESQSRSLIRATNEILLPSDRPPHAGTYPLARMHSPPQTSGMMLSPPCVSLSPSCSTSKDISTTTETNGGMRTGSNAHEPPRNYHYGVTVRSHSSSLSPDADPDEVGLMSSSMMMMMRRRASSVSTLCFDNHAHNGEGCTDKGYAEERAKRGEQHRGAERDSSFTINTLITTTAFGSVPRRIEAPQPTCSPKEESQHRQQQPYNLSNSSDPLIFEEGNNHHDHNTNQNYNHHHHHHRGDRGQGRDGSRSQESAVRGRRERIELPVVTAEEADLVLREGKGITAASLDTYGGGGGARGGEEERPRNGTTTTNITSACINNSKGDDEDDIEIHRLRSRRVVAAPLPTSTDLIFSSSSSISAFSAANSALAILKCRTALSALSDSSPMVTPAPREAERAPRPSSRSNTIINSIGLGRTHKDSDDDDGHLYVHDISFNKYRSNNSSSNMRLHQDSYEGEGRVVDHTLDLVHVGVAKASTTMAKEEFPVTRKFYAPSRSRSRSNGALGNGAATATAEPILCGWEKRPSEEPFHSVDVEHMYVEGKGKSGHHEMLERAAHYPHKSRSASQLSRNYTVDPTSDAGAVAVASPERATAQPASVRNDVPTRPTPTPIPIANSLSRSRSASARHDQDETTGSSIHTDTDHNGSYHGSYTRPQPREKSMQEDEKEERQRSADLTESERRELSLLRQLYDRRTQQQGERGEQREDDFYIAQRPPSSEQKASYAIDTTTTTRNYKGNKDQFYRVYQEQQQQQRHREDLSRTKVMTATVKDTTSSTSRSESFVVGDMAERATTGRGSTTHSSAHMYYDVCHMYYAGMNTSQTEDSNRCSEGEGEVQQLKGLPRSHHHRQREDQDHLNRPQEAPKRGALLYNTSPQYNTYTYTSNTSVDKTRSPSASSASPASSHFFSEMRERALAFQRLLESTERRGYATESENSFVLQGGREDNNNNNNNNNNRTIGSTSRTPFPAATAESDYTAINGTRMMQTEGYGGGDTHRHPIAYASPTHDVEETETPLRAVSFPPAYEELFSASPQYVPRDSRHHQRDERTASSANTIAAHQRPYTYAPSTQTTHDSNTDQNPTVTPSTSSPPHTDNSTETKRRLIRELFFSNANILNNTNSQPQHLLHTYSPEDSHPKYDQRLHRHERQGLRYKSTDHGDTSYSPSTASPLVGTRGGGGGGRGTPESASKLNRNVKAMLRALKPMARLVLSDLSLCDREGSGVLPAEACATILNTRLATITSLEDRENEGLPSPVVPLLSPADVVAFATALSSSSNDDDDDDDDDPENAVSMYSRYDGNNAAGVVNYSDFVAKLMEVE